MNFKRGLAQSDTGYPASGTTRLPLSLLTELQKRLLLSHKVKYDAHSARRPMRRQRKGCGKALILLQTALHSNYPKPFTPETWIPYQLAKPAEVSVSIHAADGKLVRTLALGQLPAGVYQSKVRAAYWDGTNEQGEPVVSGAYFYRLSAGEFTATRKMLIRK